MFICLFVCLFVCWPVCFFYFNHLGTPTGIYPENLVKIGLDLAEIYRLFKNVHVFDCLLTHLFFILIILGHPQEYTLKSLWRLDLIWLRYLGSKNIFLFVWLLVYLFVCFFYFNHFRTPTGSYPKNFVKIRLDLAEVFRI